MSHEMTIAELDAESAELLPSREALSRFDLNFFKSNAASVSATNLALAVNAGGGKNSAALANAVQGITIFQG